MYIVLWFLSISRTRPDQYQWTWCNVMWILLCDRHSNQWRSIKIRNIEILLPAHHSPHTTQYTSEHETSNSCIVLELELTAHTKNMPRFSWAKTWFFILKQRLEVSQSRNVKSYLTLTIHLFQCWWCWCFRSPGTLQTRPGWSTASSGPASWLWGNKIRYN